MLIYLAAALFVLLGAVQIGANDESGTGYFYQQEPESAPTRASCVNVFEDLRSGREEDVGGVVRSLKSINVDYLLDDYDNALTRDRRKANYLKLDGLLQEVEAHKREIYCRIEMAIYMKDNPAFAGPAYEQLLAEAFNRLEETYASAKKSLERGDYARAVYAFDLIAPYSGAYGLSLQAAKKQKESSAEKVTSTESSPQADSGDKDKPPVGNAGPISSAVVAGRVDRPQETVLSPGPIALAARIGAITQAADVE